MKQSDPKDEPARGAEGGEAKSSDTLLIHGVSPDGERLAVLRAREDRVEAGVVQRVKEGESITGELVRLKPRPEFPLLCDVEVELPSPSQRKPDAPRLSHGGPAQVATTSYRANWDAIWSRGKKGAPN